MHPELKWSFELCSQEFSCGSGGSRHPREGNMVKI